ncbi:hypothetical protein [Paenibacillus phytohabitans]|uniref:hypothetical protein n=2 Tax=Paenibacillus TaxID=44249 RepID=UPI00300B83D4
MIIETCFEIMWKVVTFERKGVYMRLRWSIPIELYILSNDEVQTCYKIKFEYKGMESVVEFISEFSGQKIQNDKTSFNYYKTKYIQFTIEDKPDSDNVSQLIEDRKKLTKTMFKLTNRVIKNLRVHGLIPYLHELVLMDENYYDFLFDSLNPTFSSDNINWKNVSDFRISILNNLSRYPNDLVKRESNYSFSMDYGRWEKVREQIIADNPIPTELDLYLNSIEHLRSKNYRLSVLESVIGLEVALTGFLREYLKNRKKFTKKKIEEFLKPEFGLSARLSGLLDLTINPKSLEQVNLETVKNVVNWRNKIVHSIGQIPEGVSEQQIEDGIEQVLMLLIILHNKKNIVHDFPDTTISPLV